jgi:hypothetical protein
VRSIGERKEERGKKREERRERKEERGKKRREGRVREGERESERKRKQEDTLLFLE